MSPQRNHEFVRDEVLPSYYENALQAFISTAAFNLVLRKVAASDTTIEVPADADDDLVALAIDGRWRFREATVQRIMPGGAAGAYDIFATAKENDISSSPLPFTDETDYTFDLAIVAAGTEPTIVPGTVDVHRKIGTLVWSGSVITAVTQTVPPLQSHGGSHTAADSLDWAAVAAQLLKRGTLAARPSFATNTDRYYLATDTVVLYQSDGSAWIEVARGGMKPRRKWLSWTRPSSASWGAVNGSAGELRVSVASGQIFSLLLATSRLSSGSGTTFKLERSTDLGATWNTLTGFGAIAPTGDQLVTVTDPADVPLADGDLIRLVVTAVGSGLGGHVEAVLLDTL